MKKNNLTKKLICAALAGVMVLSSSSLVFAGNKMGMKQKSIRKPSVGVTMTKGAHGGLQEVLNQMVKEGTLTQAKVDAITKYFEQKQAEKQKMTLEQLQALKAAPKVSILDQLKNGGVLTEAEVNSIMDMKAKLKDEKLTAALNSLVEKSVLKSDDVSKIKAFLQAERVARKAECQKIKAMTEAERKAYFEQNKTTRVDVIQKMVNQKIITAEQAAELRKVMPGKHRKGHKGGFKGMMKFAPKTNTIPKL